MKDSIQFPNILVSEDGKTVLSKNVKELRQFNQSNKPHVIIDRSPNPVQLLVALAYHQNEYQTGLRVLNISGDYQNTHHSNLR